MSLWPPATDPSSANAQTTSPHPRPPPLYAAGCQSFGLYSAEWSRRPSQHVRLGVAFLSFRCGVNPTSQTPVLTFCGGEQIASGCAYGRATWKRKLCGFIVGVDGD